MDTARFKKIISDQLFVVKKQLNRFGRWSTRTPRRKAAWILLVSFIFNQFVYPYIPFLSSKDVLANGNIESVTFGTSLFVNRNPDFNVWFGDRLDQSKHKIVFEVEGKEIEMRLQEATSSANLPSTLPSVNGSPSPNLGESWGEVLKNIADVEKLSDKLRNELQKPFLTTVEKDNTVADVLDQKIGDFATIRYEILPDRGVKESILIQSPSPGHLAPSTFNFEMKLSGGVQLKQKLENLNDAQLNASDSSKIQDLRSKIYYFVDKNGKYLAHFEPLIMIDAAGAMSNDIKMDITPSSCLLVTCYSVTITASDQWLNANERVFPIDLDPTIVHDQNPDFSSGTENRSKVNASNAVEVQYKELQADINTVGLWHFNEGSGSTAYDASGNGNNGTLTNGPVWNGPVDSKTGLGKSSIKFDGVDDVINISDTTTLKNQDFTIEAWIKPNSVTGNHDIVVQNKTTQYVALYTIGTGFKFYSASLSPTNLGAF